MFHLAGISSYHEYDATAESQVNISHRALRKRAIQYEDDSDDGLDTLNGPKINHRR